MQFNNACVIHLLERTKVDYQAIKSPYKFICLRIVKPLLHTSEATEISMSIEFILQGNSKRSRVFTITMCSENLLENNGMKRCSLVNNVKTAF